MRLATIALMMLTLVGCPQPGPDDTGEADTDTDVDTGATLATCPQCVPHDFGTWRLPMFPPPDDWTTVIGTWALNADGDWFPDMEQGAVANAEYVLPLVEGDQMLELIVGGYGLSAGIDRDPQAPGSSTPTIAGGVVGPDNPESFPVNAFIEEGVAYTVCVEGTSEATLHTVDLIFQAAP